MKTIKKLLVVMMCIALAGGMMMPANTYAKSKKIKLNKTKATLTVGKTKKLKLKNAKAKKVKWSSTKKSVAKVSKKGVVKAIKAGKATIKAKYKKKVYKAKIVVKKKQKSLKGNQLNQGVYLLDSLYDDKNIIVSPLSVNMVLGMMGNGADSVAKNDIEKYFGQSMDAVNTQSKDLVYNNDGVLKIANSFWHKDGTTVMDGFKNAVTDYYKASVQSTPMNQSTVNDVNKWVAKNTDDMIQKLIDIDDIDSLTRTIAVNALLFDAKWTHPFDPDLTQDEKFTRFDGSTKTVNMMHDWDDVYYENSKALAFEKTYNPEKKYKFIGILPKKKGKFSLDNLDIASLLDGKKGGSLTDVSIKMPRFEYEWNNELTGTLAKTSLKSIFDFGNPHFDKIIKEDKLCVQKVIQSCKIKVEEKGTKAAAATSFSGVTSAVKPIPKVVYIHLDRPFAYLIIDKDNNVLFVGKCVNP